MENLSNLERVLLQNDKRGELAIAGFQASVAFIVLLFHTISAWRSNWETFSALTFGLAVLIALACLLRLWGTRLNPMPRLALNSLTVVDGVLIFALIASYSFAYNLPIESSFKAPSTIFLVVYTCIRVVKLDPVPLLISGATVMSGWLALFIYSLNMQTNRTFFYAEYVTSGKVLIGAPLEMAVGYLVIVFVLVAATSYARRILANTADMRDLLEAKSSAEKSSIQHSALFNGSSDGIIVVDEFGQIEQVNNAIKDMFGYEPNALIGQSVAILMSNENASKLAQDIRRFRTNEDAKLIGTPFESEGLNFDGDVFPIELTISDFTVANKLQFTGIVRDISARNQSSRNELAALSKFEDVVTSALDAIVIIDEAGKVVEFNPAAQEIFGYTLDQTIGQDLAELIIPKDHRQAHRSGMKHYLKTGEGPVLNQRIEINAITAAGAEILVELAVIENKTADGVMFISFLRDITERKAARVALYEAKDRAEVANRAKASFLAMMSHEIRTPMNGVLGILTLLSDTVTQKEDAKLIKTARKSGKALLTIINDILDFSKLEAGKLDLEIGSFFADSLLNSVHSLVSQQASEKNLLLSFSTSDNVPKALRGDQDRIRQIMLNLVWYAVKFTDSGTVEVVLSRVCGDEDSRYRIEVRDSGIGVPADKQGELFAEFATIDSSYARKFGGTGLGLSICKTLTEAMDGEIGYLPNLSNGSIFWFELPLELADPASVVQDSDESKANDVLKFTANIRVLLAEDNMTNQLVLGNMLERMGCIVDAVSNGQEAIEGASARNYDVILMDMSMPEMDGIMATKLIRKSPAPLCDIPIIALTAYALDEDRQRAISAGMNEFVPKPVSRIELARAIARQTDAGLTESDLEKPQQPLFDQAILEENFVGMDDELRGRVLKEFNLGILRHLKRIAEAVNTKDLEKFERATHGINGLSGTFGATELQHLANQVNVIAREGNVDSAFSRADEIRELAEAVLESVGEKTE